MGMSYRNIISTNILKDIFQKYEVTFLVIDNSKIHKLLNKKKYKILVLKKKLLNRLFIRAFSIIELLQYCSFYQKHKTRTIKKYIVKKNQNIAFPILYLISWIIGLFFDKYSFFSWHYKYFIDKEIKNKILKFDRVFLLSTDYIIDKSILKICKDCNTPVSVFVHSWDNLAGRGFFSERPDNLLVWNDTMKKQAQILHNIPEKNIYVVGVPQFWFYKQLENKVNKAFFFRHYIKEKKKTITYTCCASRVFPDEDLFIEKLINFIKKNKFNLILRLHTTERIKFYKKKFSNIDNVVIDTPGGLFAASEVNNLNDTKIEILRFLSLMKYSNVVINLASTITLDAIIFDTPVVCPAFNIKKIKKRQWNEAKEWYKSTHFKYIVESKSIRVAKNMKELKKYILMYLKNKKTDSINRKKLSKEFCKINIDVKKKISNFI